MLLVVVIFLTLNFYVKNIFGSNVKDIITAKSNTMSDKYADMEADIYLLIVAAVIVILLTALSGKKLQKHFNIMPYALAGELVLGFCFMFGPKIDNYNTMWFSDRKEELNSYMDKYLEIPYDSNFSRIHVKSYIT